MLTNTVKYQMLMVNSPQQGYGYTSSLFLVFGIVSFLALLFLGSKLITKKNLFGSKSKYMEIQDRIYIGQDKQIVIVKILKEYYILSITQNSCNVIEKIQEESFDKLNISDEEVGNTKSFKEILKLIKINRGQE